MQNHAYLHNTLLRVVVLFHKSNEKKLTVLLSGREISVLKPGQDTIIITAFLFGNNHQVKRITVCLLFQGSTKITRSRESYLDVQVILNPDPLKMYVVDEITSRDCLPALATRT